MTGAAPPRFDAPRFAAVAFDMDGVLVDSEPAFFAAVNDILARYGTHISVEEYAPNIGSSTAATWTRVSALKGVKVPLDELTEEFEAPLMQRLREPRPALPGAKELLLRLRERSVPVALCTASYTRWCEAILGGAGLDGMFEIMSTADMVERTKPDPAPYALAAKLLGVPPARCIAIEDSRNGVISAVGAGLYVLQLRATSTAAAPVEEIAGVLGSLDEFPMALLDR